MVFLCNQTRTNDKLKTWPIIQFYSWHIIYIAGIRFLVTVNVIKVCPMVITHTVHKVRLGKKKGRKGFKEYSFIRNGWIRICCSVWEAHLRSARRWKHTPQEVCTCFGLSAWGRSWIWTIAWCIWHQYCNWHHFQYMCGPKKRSSTGLVKRLLSTSTCNIKAGRQLVNKCALHILEACTLLNVRKLVIDFVCLGCTETIRISVRPGFFFGRLCLIFHWVESINVHFRIYL